MKRVLIAAVALLTVAGCSEAGLTSADAYKIGCPAVDSVAAGGTLANKATVAGLKQLRDSGQLGADAQKWTEAAIAALQSAKPEDLPAESRKIIVDGCATNGYPLRNLK